MFAHEKLQVYGKAIAFVAAASNFSEAWSRKHAVVDQLERAADSMILNLAEGTRMRSGPGKLKALDYAVGSGLECAACLDVARIKGLLREAETEHEKTHLCEVVKMLIGLRKAWGLSMHEDSVPYGVPPRAPKHLFHHEMLEVYAASLELMVWFVSLPGAKELSNSLYKRIDEGATSVVLNIAESNGRYSELDHRRFLDIAQSAAVKVAAYLDLASQRLTLSQKECGPAKALLERIVAMLSRM
jgi:four helix bundle protein